MSSGASETLAPGTRLGDGGRYEIRRRIGVGGMAEVYKAIDTRLGDRVVAIKILSAEAAEHPFAAKMRTLFIQEAQALSRIVDENVVDVLDFGAAEDAAPFMVMELLHGTDLGVFLKRVKQMPIGEAVDTMLAVCAGVHACHLAGIIHRDLKPANVFLARTVSGRQPKVLDFSVAKIPVRGDGGAEQTRTDLIVGTPSYMSPEQALGRPATELSDQYSIGALLYRCLTGRPPRGVMPRLREALPDIAENLEAAILRALDPVPEKRFASVHELGRSLLPFGSPSANARWAAYYHESPRPFDPNTTGSLSRELVHPATSVEPPSRAPTIPVGPYDFLAHERTTRSESAGSAERSIETASSAEPTVVDLVPEPGPVASDLDELTTLDVVGSSPPPSVRDTAAVGRQDEIDHPEPGSAPYAERAPDRTALKMSVGFALAGIVVVAVASVGIHRLRRRQHVEIARPPAALTGAAGTARKTRQVAVPFVARPTKVTFAPPAPSPATAPLAGQPIAGTAALTPGSPAGPDLERHSRFAKRSRRRVPVSGPGTITYGQDGLPIIY